MIEKNKEIKYMERQIKKEGCKEKINNSQRRLNKSNPFDEQVKRCSIKKSKLGIF